MAVAGADSLGTLVLTLTADGRQYMQGLTDVQNATSGAVETIVGTFEYGFTAISAIVAATLAAAIKSYADFEEDLVAATANMSGATEEMRIQMAATAVELSNNGVNSADDLAKAYGALKENGKDAAQAIRDIAVADQFAISAHTDSATAAQTLARAEVAVGMASRDAATDAQHLVEVADAVTLAAREGNSSQMAFASALASSGTQIRMLSGGMTEGLAIMAAYTQQGKDAGTAASNLNMMIRSLTQSASTHAEVWKQFGMSIYDASGRLKPMADIIGMLESQMAGLSPQETRQMEQMLGFQARSLMAMQALFGMSGAIRQMQSDFENAGGTMDSVANVQMGTFNAQAKEMWNNVHNLFITLGSELVPILEALNKLLIPMLKTWTDNDAAIISNQAHTKQLTETQKTFVEGISLVIDLVRYLTEGFLMGEQVIIALMGAFNELWLTAKMVFGALTYIVDAFYVGAREGLDVLVAGFLEGLTDMAELANKILPKKLQIDTTQFHAAIASVVSDYDALNNQLTQSKTNMDTYAKDWLNFQKDLVAGTDEYTMALDQVDKQIESVQNWKFTGSAFEKSVNDMVTGTAGVVYAWGTVNTQIRLTGGSLEDYTHRASQLPQTVELLKTIANAWETNAQKVLDFNKALGSGQVSVSQYLMAMEKLNVLGVEDPFAKTMVSLTQLDDAYVNGQETLIRYNQQLRNGTISQAQYDAQVAAGVMSTDAYTAAREKLLRTYTQVKTGSSQLDAITALKNQLTDEQALWRQEQADSTHWATLTAQDKVRITEAANSRILTLTQDLANKQKEFYLTMDQTVLSSASTLATGLENLATKGTTAYKAAYVMEKAIAIAQAIVQTQLAATKALAEGGPILGPEMAAMMEALGYANVAVMVATDIANFEGGGFTASGSRSGGVDNRGGMYAILHPDEQVIDLTKTREGQSHSVTVNQNFASGVSHAELNAKAEQIKRETMRAVLDGIARGGTFRKNVQR